MPGLGAGHWEQDGSQRDPGGMPVFGGRWALPFSLPSLSFLICHMEGSQCSTLAVGASDTRTEAGVFCRLFCGCLAGQVSGPAHPSGVTLSPTLSGGQRFPGASSPEGFHAGLRGTGSAADGSRLALVSLILAVPPWGGA